MRPLPPLGEICSHHHVRAFIVVEERDRELVVVRCVGDTEQIDSSDDCVEQRSSSALERRGKEASSRRTFKGEENSTKHRYSSVRTGVGFKAVRMARLRRGSVGSYETSLLWNMASLSRLGSSLINFDKTRHHTDP